MKMKDVAKLANVSPATVSRVLSHPDLVQKETRERVLEVIKELNYQPNLVARQFRKKETKIILVVVPDITSSFFSKILRGIEHVASRHGYQVILCDTDNDLEKEREYINLLYQKQADGVILLTARLGQQELENLSKEFPMVLACEYIDELNVPTVSVDNISSSRKMTEYLIRLGHTKIAHITGRINGVLGRDRLKGFQQALMTHNLEIDSAYIQEGDVSLDSGYHQMQKLLALETPPTAVFVFNDEMAYGALKAAKDHGIEVPENLAIVGFDNLEISMIVDPPLTTIHQPRYEIGKKAMTLLLQLLSGTDMQQKKFIMKDTIVIRESCGGNGDKEVV